MNIRRSLIIVRKDLTAGSRAFLFIWILMFPLIITLVVRMVFGGLIDSSPRLGVVDLGAAEVWSALDATPGIDVTRFNSVELLEERVRDGGLDAGLILRAGFVDALRENKRPELEFFVSGESLASDRMILSTAVTSAVRNAAGMTTEVTVERELVGKGSQVPIQDRLVPLLVLFAVAMAGIFLTASNIVGERESGTIRAVLSTTARTGEFFLAKGIVGFLMALVLGILTLLLNGGFSSAIAGQIVVLSVAALMCVQFGLMLGATAGDMTTMFTVWKSGAILILAPAILFLFPSLPEWIAMLFPTYYFLSPLYDMAVEGSTLGDVLGLLMVGVGLSVLLAMGVGLLGRRMERTLAEN
jgi:ABC-2 type transport system permease protein